METKKFGIVGMSCIGCAKSAEQVLQKIDGVKSAEVSFTNATAYLTFDESKVNYQTLAHPVKQLGYTLIADSQTLESQRKINLARLKTKVIVAALFTFPVVVLSMGFPDAAFSGYIQAILTLPVVFFSGIGFYKSAWLQFKSSTSSMDTLVALGTGAAFILSWIYLFLPELNPHQNHLYFETAAVIITFILIGKYIEENVKYNTSTSLNTLLSINIDYIDVIKADIPTKTLVDNVTLGDIVLVKPGARIGVDGHLIENNALIDESMLTGEPIPVQKQIGDMVYAGTVNTGQGIKIVTVNKGRETLLSKIIFAVEQAQQQRPRFQNLTDKLVSLFVPIVVVISITTFLGWWILDESVTTGLTACLTVLVVSCPCALGLATPLAIQAALNKSTQLGLIIKNINVFETAPQIKTVAFDKTGTLTTGIPQVINVEWLTDANDNTFLYYGLGLVEHSTHPLSGALINWFETQGISPVIYETVVETLGQGLYGLVNNQTWYIGKYDWIKSKVSTPLTPNAEARINQSQHTQVVITNEKNWWLIEFDDVVKADAQEVVKGLKLQGKYVVMLSGDRAQAAHQKAKQLGIQQVYAELLPETKASIIQELKQNSTKVAMVGDGLNDSVALSVADVSIAMQNGSSLTVSIADVTLMKQSLRPILEFFKLSRRLNIIIQQNLIFAFGYNLVGIPVATGIVPGLTLNPMVAGIFMALSSVVVVLNSKRLTN